MIVEQTGDVNEHILRHRIILASSVNALVQTIR